LLGLGEGVGLSLGDGLGVGVVPGFLKANDVLNPAEICFQVVSIPICIGLLVDILVPSPNCPASFTPHAHKVPLLFMAIMKFSPAAIRLQSFPVPTCVGTLKLPRFDCPFPELPVPHVHRVPSFFIAAVGT
jgi:hypothetical protein